jgi:hypothetical protein
MEKRFDSLFTAHDVFDKGRNDEIDCSAVPVYHTRG